MKLHLMRQHSTSTKGLASEAILLANTPNEIQTTHPPTVRKNYEVSMAAVIGIRLSFLGPRCVRTNWASAAWNEVGRLTEGWLNLICERLLLARHFIIAPQMVDVK